MNWQIYAAGDQQHAVVDSLPELKALTQATTGKAFRRIGRFIQLALIGASRCVQGQQLPTDTGVYFASGRGDLELTLEIMTQLYRDAQTPKPLNFVNTVSNAACFYLAQHLALQARSNFVCNRYFAFESVLQLATLDLTMGPVTSALVGSVDIATAPLNDHRQRLQQSGDTAMGEGSHWLWIGPTNTQRPRLGEILATQHFADKDVLIEWIKRRIDARQCQFAAGQFLSSPEVQHIREAGDLNDEFDYRSERAYYDSQSGAVISEFLRNPSKATQLLHINADEMGRYSVMWVAR